VFSVLVITFISLLITKKITFPFIYCVPTGSDFSLGTILTSNPLSINKAEIQHLDPYQFKCSPPVQFMADPFIVEDKDLYYLFFEQVNRKMFSKGADIAVIKSKDLINWKHLGVILREPFHLSYPNVFKWNDKWYMIPETVAKHEVRLYESTEFPFKWKYITSIIDKMILDPTLFIVNGTLYVLGQSVEDRSLRLYFSDNLFSGWVEHSSSPIRFGENETQPAGKPGIINGEFTYFVQDHSKGYGTAVIAYQIEEISKTNFIDKRLKNNPVLSQFGNEWAECGMHHISWINTNYEKYFCVVDGVDRIKNKKWKFSIFNFPEFTI